VENAADINRLLKGEPMAGKIEEGDFILSIARRHSPNGSGVKTVYTVLDSYDATLVGGKKGVVFNVVPHSTFALVGVPGPLAHELTTNQFIELTRQDEPYLAGSHDVSDPSIPGYVYEIAKAKTLNKSVHGSMSGKLRNGDYVMVVDEGRHGEGGLREYAVLERLTLGWVEKPDTRFLGPTFVGSFLTEVKPDEYYTLTTGGMAYHKDYGRELDLKNAGGPMGPAFSR